MMSKQRLTAHSQTGSIQNQNLEVNRRWIKTTDFLMILKIRHKDSKKPSSTGKQKVEPEI